MSDGPLKMGTAEEFAACRRLLQAVNYTEEGLRERYHLGALSGLLSPARPEPAEDALGLLTRLFIDGRSATRAQIASALSPSALEALAALALLEPTPGNPELWTATVMLYPRAGVFLVSDRPTNPDGTPPQEIRELVFSALTENTERFMEVIPDQPCGRVLDLGTGTGVAALIAARSAGEVWAVDITERATRFAEFNRQLNDVANVTVCQGDLYGPVEDLRFDRITIHPPYVPALEQALIYQDGGLDGQDITRRAVSQLPRHLSPGGRFYCLTLGVDSENASFENIVRQWLQPDDASFDVAFVPRHSISVAFLARSVAVKSMNSLRDAVRLEQAFQRLKIREFVYGDIIIQRHLTPRPSFTVRRQRAPGSERAELEWLLRWETELASRGSEWLLDTRPRPSPDVELLVTHSVASGELTPTGYRLQTAYPFSMEAKAPAWMAVLIARCDGKLSARDHYASLRQEKAFPDSVTPADFSRLVGQLISGGFILISEAEIPRYR